MSDAVTPAPMPRRVELVRGMARSWWLFLLRGAAAILFGIIALVAPGAALFTILAFLAAWFLVDGVATIVQAIAGPKERHGFWFWVDGIVSVIAAAVVLFMPGLSAVTLVIVAGVWSIVVGVMRLVTAFQVQDVWLGLLGAVAVFIGAWLIVSPGPGLLALIWVVALQAMLIGVLFLMLGWRLRRIARLHPVARAP